MLRIVFLSVLLTVLPGWARGQAKQADAWRQKAETFYATGQYDSATVYYQKAYRLVQHTDPARAANLCVDLSSMDYMNGHNQVAIDRCHTGLRHLRMATHPPDSAAFKLFSSLGTFHKEIYHIDSAQTYFGKADALLAKNPRISVQIPLYVLYHYNNQGNWFMKTGNSAKSLVYLTKARALAERFGSAEDKSYVEGNLAGYYDARQDFKKSLIHWLLANRFHPKRDIQQSRNLSGIGWTLFNLHRYQAALAYFSAADRVLTTLRRGKRADEYIVNQANLWFMIGTCHRAGGSLPKADHYLEQGIRLHRQYLGPQGPLLAQLLVEQGQVLEARHALKPALYQYQAAIRAVCRDTTLLPVGLSNPAAEATLDEPTLLLAVWRKAAVLKKLYDTTQANPYLTEAVTTYRYCVALQQRIRHGIDTDPAQVLFTARQHRLVPESIAVVFTAWQRQPTAYLRETLFQLFEQAQASSLSEALRLTAIKPQAIPATLLDREHWLKARIGDLRRHPVSDTAAQNKLIACQLEWHQLLDRFRHDFPAYYRLSYQPATTSSAAVQHRLDNQTAYVAYVREDTHLFILVVTRQTIRVVRQVIDPAHVDRQLATLRQQLYQDPVLTRYEGTTSAADLYQTCITPIQPYLIGKTRLIITRDWSFNFLPFEVLETGQRADDYLTHRYAIAYAFSAELFFNQSARPVLTNPVLVVAPFVRGEAIGRAARGQQPFGPLASSEAEARSIGGEILAGPGATLSVFRNTALARSIVYLATHAQTDDADPANSFIAFYPDSTDKLYTDDIYDMDFSATGLVVLGACAAGAGKTSQGEGVLSLARAFAYAGCPAVVTTLWKANDETTSFLTLQLHGYLSRGLPTDQALQRARQDFFASSLFAKYNHPYYWANYTLMGNHAPVVPPPAMPVVGGIMAIVSLLGLGAFWKRSWLAGLIRRRLK